MLEQHKISRLNLVESENVQEENDLQRALKHGSGTRTYR